MGRNDSAGSGGLSRRQFLGIAVGTAAGAVLLGSTRALAERLGQQADGGLNGVARFDGGVVAVSADGSGGQVWQSRDGRQWARVATRGLDAAVLNGVTAGGPGLVAVGVDRGGIPAIWTSPDATGWSRVDLGQVENGYMVDVAQVGPRLIAVGALLDPETGEPTSGAVWQSTSGERWQRLGGGQGSAFDLNEGTLTGIASSGQRVLAVGFGLDGGAVWTSPNGLTWTRVPTDPAVFAASAILGVTDTGAGFVAVGATIPDNRPVVWSSPDGTRWSRSEPALQESEPRDAVGGLPGLVVVGRRGTNAPGAWVSPDGAEFTQTL